MCMKRCIKDINKYFENNIILWWNTNECARVNFYYKIGRAHV